MENELIASMDEFVVATNDSPIIGTFALATCVGLLMYDDSGHYALAHILHDYEIIIKKMLTFMENKAPIHIILVPGYDTTGEKLIEIIQFLKNKDHFLLYDFDIEIKRLIEFLDTKTMSIEFKYDTINNKFISFKSNSLRIK